MWSSTSGGSSSDYPSFSSSHTSYYHQNDDEHEPMMHAASHAYGTSYSSMRRRRQGPVSRLGASLGERVQSELKKHGGMQSFVRRYKLMLAIYGAIAVAFLLALWGGLRSSSSHHRPIVGPHNYSRGRGPSYYSKGGSSGGKLRRTGSGGGVKSSSSSSSMKGQPNPPRFAPGGLPSADGPPTKKEKGESKGRTRRKEFLSSIGGSKMEKAMEEEKRGEEEQSSVPEEAAVVEEEPNVHAFALEEGGVDTGKEEDDAFLPSPSAAAGHWPEASQHVVSPLVTEQVAVQEEEAAAATATPAYVTTRAGEPIAVISPPCGGEGSCPTSTQEGQHRHQQQQQQKEEEEEEVVMDVAKGPTFVPTHATAAEAVVGGEQEMKEAPPTMCGAGAEHLLEEEKGAGEASTTAAAVPVPEPAPAAEDSEGQQAQQKEEQEGVVCNKELDSYVAAMLGR